MWDQIEAMLEAIGIGYFGALGYIAVVVFVFWLIGRGKGGNGQ